MQHYTLGDKKIPQSMMGEYKVREERRERVVLHFCFLVDQAPEGPDLSTLEYGETHDKMMKERARINQVKPALVSILALLCDLFLFTTTAFPLIRVQ